MRTKAVWLHSNLPSVAKRHKTNDWAQNLQWKCGQSVVKTCIRRPKPGAHGLLTRGLLVFHVSPQWDSNPHWIDFKSTVSADWTMGGAGFYPTTV